MKKTVKFALLVAAALVVAGGIIGAVAQWRMGWTFKAPELGDSDVTAHTETFSPAEVTDIRVILESWDAEIIPADGDMIEVTWRSREADAASARLLDGRLTVEQRRASSLKDWRRWFGVSWYSGTELTVALPGKLSGELYLSGDSGDVSVDSLKVGALSVLMTTGDMEIREVSAAGDVSMQVTTGSVEAVSVSAGKGFSAQATTGDIDLRQVSAKKDLSADANTGSADLTDCSAAGLLSASAGAGDVELRRCSGNDISAACTTGSIELGELSVSRGITLETTTGDVSGVLPGSIADYEIHSTVVTGDSTVPSESYGGPKYLTVSVITGSADLSFESQPHSN